MVSYAALTWKVSHGHFVASCGTQSQSSGVILENAA